MSNCINTDTHLQSSTSPRPHATGSWRNLPVWGDSRSSYVAASIRAWSPRVARWTLPIQRRWWSRDDKSPRSPRDSFLTVQLSIRGYNVYICQFASLRFLLSLWMTTLIGAQYSSFMQYKFQFYIKISCSNLSIFFLLGIKSCKFRTSAYDVVWRFYGKVETTADCLLV